MDTSPLRRGYTVDLLAWSIAVCSVLIISAVVFGIFRLSAAAYQRIGIDESQVLLNDSRFQDVKAQMGRFFERAPVVGVVQNYQTLPPKELRALCDGLLDSLAEFNSRNFDSLYASIRKLSSYRPLLADYPDLRTAWNRIETLAKKGDEQFRKLQDIEGRMSELNQQLRSATDQYNLLSRDVSELFSLRAASEFEPGVIPPFYRAGVLAGLPSIKGVNDDIPSLEALKLALEQAGGKVVVGGTDIAGTFRLKLEALQDTGKGVFDKFVEISKESSDLQRQADAIEAELVSIGQRIDSFSKRFLLAVLKGPQLAQ